MIKLFHSPNSRSVSILWLLEELEIPYEVELINIHNDAGAPEGYREIQPNKKVPALMHDGNIITERAAIALYLCEHFNELNLAPDVHDLRRGEFLTMMVYCDSVLDPVMAVKAKGWDYNSKEFSFGLFEDMIRFLEKKLSSQLYAVGDEFTAADTQLASALNWGINFTQIFPKKTVFTNYLNRVTSRPAYLRTLKKNEAFLKEPWADALLFNMHPSRENKTEHSSFYGDGFA